MDQKNNIRMPSFMKRAFYGIIATIATLASIVTVVAYVYPPVSNPRIEAVISGVEHLTAAPAESRLQATYIYNGNVVKDVWRFRIEMKHVNGPTIVGRGARSTVIGELLPINIDYPCQILAYNVERNMINAEIDKINENSFSIKFEQWRKNDAINISVTVSISDADKKTINASFFSSGRKIIDGDIIFIDSNNLNLDKSKNALDYILSERGAFISRMLLSMLAFILLLFPFGGFVAIREQLKDYYQLRTWINDFRPSALQYFLTHATDDVKSKLAARPKTDQNILYSLMNTSHAEFWINFKNRPGALSWLYINKKFPTAEVLMLILLSVFFAILSVSLLAVLWPWPF